MNWKRGGGGTFSFYEVGEDRCDYEEVDVGGKNKHWGTITLEPDPNDWRRTSFIMKDSRTINNDLCTFSGRFFGDEVRDCELQCTSGFTSACANFQPQKDQTLCEKYELRVGAGRRQLEPLYDTVSDLGSWWMVYGADNWVAMWTRRDGSNIFDGEWQRGKVGSQFRSAGRTGR